MNIGKRITQLKTQKNMSTNHLANKAGVSQSYLRDIELGNKNPTVEMLSYICDALEISICGFFTEDINNISPFLLSAINLLNEKEQIKLADFIYELKKDKYEI